jgi:hypothetical protein
VKDNAAFKDSFLLVPGFSEESCPGWKTADSPIMQRYLISPAVSIQQPKGSSPGSTSLAAHTIDLTANSVSIHKQTDPYEANRSKFFTVPRQSMVGENKSLSAVEELNELLSQANSAGHAPGNSTSLYKNHLEVSVLQVLSVCPKATARQSITYVWNLYLTDRPSSVPQQLVRSFVSAWHWEFHVQLSPAILLAAFLPVSAYFGAMTVDDHLIALRMRFNDLKWEDATVILFKKWMEQTVVPLMINLLDEGRAAMENYIYLLSVLFNMRFKFQNALLLALDRSTLWLRDKANLLGQRSSAAQTLILYTFSMLAHNFNRVFVSMVSSDRESE